MKKQSIHACKYRETPIQRCDNKEDIDNFGLFSYEKSRFKNTVRQKLLSQCDVPIARRIFSRTMLRIEYLGTGLRCVECWPVKSDDDSIIFYPRNSSLNTATYVKLLAIVLPVKKCELEITDHLHPLRIRT